MRLGEEPSAWVQGLLSAPYLPVTVAPNCSPPPSRVPSTLPAVVKMLPLTDPSLIPGPKDSQMHSFDFSVLF